MNWRDLIRSAGNALIARGFGVFAVFLLNLLIARTTGPEGLGSFAVALAIAKLSSVLARIGLEQPILRLTATHQELGQRRTTAKTVLAGVSLAVIVSAFLSGLIIGYSNLIAEQLFKDGSLGQIIRLMALTIPPITICLLVSQALRGLGQSSVSLITQFGLAPFLAVCWLAFNTNADINAVAIAYVWASITAAVLTLMWWGWHVRHPTEGHISSPTPQQLLQPGFVLYGADIASQLMLLSPILLLGILSNTENTGFYQVAQQLAGVTSLALVAIGSVISPRFAEAYREGDHKLLIELVQRGTRLMTIVALPVLLAFMLFPAWFMHLFGEGFENGWLALLLLAIGQFFNVAAGCVGRLLAMTGFEIAIRKAQFFATTLTFLSCILFIPSSGAVGAALAATLGLITFNGLATVSVSKHLNFNPILVTFFPGAIMRIHKK